MWVAGLSWPLTHMRVTDLILSLMAPTLLALLLVIFVVRRHYREFPFFFVYILYAPLATLRVLAGGRPLFHFWVYWITEALYGILALLVLREVFHRVFALPYDAYRWFRYLLPSALLMILGLSFSEAVIHPQGAGYIPRLITAIYWFDLGVHALEGTVLLLVIALIVVFPVAWRQHEFGILAGFGISACTTMLADVLVLNAGSRYETFFRYGPPIAYVLATFIWLHAFLRPPQSRPQSQLHPDEMLEIVRRSRKLLEKIERALGLRRHILITLV